MRFDSGSTVFMSRQNRIQKERLRYPPAVANGQPGAMGTDQKDGPGAAAAMKRPWPASRAPVQKNQTDSKVEIVVAPNRWLPPTGKPIKTANAILLFLVGPGTLWVAASQSQHINHITRRKFKGRRFPRWEHRTQTMAAMSF